MITGSVITNIIKFSVQLRICHWQTPKYSAHKAFQTTYENIDDLLDSLVEVCQGKHEHVVEIDDSSSNITLDNLSTLDIKNYIDEFAQYLNVNCRGLFDDNDTEINNIIDEMVAVVHRLKYLLTLE